MSLRNIAILLCGALLTVYIAVFALLLFYQRSLLFFGGRYEAAIDPAYQAVTIKEADGVTLKLWEALDGPHAPVVVFFYGNAGTLSDFAGIGETLNNEGYSIVLGSFRGYDGNPGQPTEDGLMNDARSILKSLPPGHGPIILWGQSLGSGIAARMASEGRANALILQSPYTAVVDVAARRFPIYPVRWFMRDRFDTFALVPKITMPVLIMHGTKDDVVPFDMGETLAHRFGAEATFVAIPNRGHNDLSVGDLFPVVDKWLKGNAARIGRQASTASTLSR